MRLRSIAFPVAAVALGLLGSLVLGELVLRAFWPQRSAVTVGMFRQDPDAGYSLQPGYENLVRVPEYTTSIRIDSEGYRVGPEDDGGGDAPLRVLAFGDSFTFGVGVEAAEAWPELLERRLDPAGNRLAVVRNGGVGGYGPLRSSRLLFAHQGEWRPNILIHGVYLGNDLEDASPATFLRLPEIRNGRMVATGAGALQRLRLFLRIHSHLYVFLRARLYDLYERMPIAEKSRYLDPMGLAGWPRDLREVSWPAARGAIREIAAWARERDAKYLVVLIPLKYQVSDEAWEAYRERWGLPDGAFDRFRVQRVVGEFLEREGIPYVDLLEDFRENSGQAESFYYPVDDHWTAAGHRLAADRIFRELSARGWIASSSSPAEPVAGIPGGAGAGG